MQDSARLNVVRIAPCSSQDSEVLRIYEKKNKKKQPGSLLIVTEDTGI
jgi:hypothetical protein